MPTHLRSHIRSGEGLFPPREAFFDQIEVTPTHWYWNGDFYEEPFSRTPVFRWGAPGRNKGIYVVARLLWCEGKEQPKRLKLRNTCGVYACVNPEHWENPDRERRFVLPEGAPASLVEQLRWVVMSAKDIREAAHRVHIVSAEAGVTVCGVSAYGPERRSADACSIITCKTCVFEWRAMGRLLEEVPDGALHP